MSPSPTSGPQWQTDAIFYEVPVKSFFDASGDGLGDFRGLTQKLDYIQELGATCIWLLPFLASPHKDDGYDVTDFRAVHPAYGTLADFQAFLAEAHRRGLRVAADIAINHTSDQHPWFQAARQAPAGSSLRQYYHWGENSEGFAGADVLFRDATPSNWSWDTQAKAFYWHRFYKHEPDLNYEHAEVRREMLKVLRFWADLGVDALCLNGAAYLAERDGTRCEHLPETHALLRQFRQELSSAYPELVLEAGVNAWPAQAHTYFGDGGGAHLTPQLSLAPRLFLALRQENAYPLVNLFEQTPAPPTGCQWITLLRNHDELALRLATDEERDYLFQEYASDPSMRIHSGILRRLAPLLDNNRQRIELAFGLLLSLPGAPLIYYGDEIGMGDNVFLGGRAGVRTPMQWSPDRNAGFSTADFARLFSPPVMDPVYGFPAVNVEAQLRDTSSRFHWIRRLIAARKSSRALSHGKMRLLTAGSSKVLAFVREVHDTDADETILVVANVARTAQPVELDLAEFGGQIPVEIFGRAAFKPIGDEPYSLTLGPHGIYWFRLQKSVMEVASRRAPVATEDVAVLPALELAGIDSLFDDRVREQLERSVLPGFLKSQRWFGGKARQISAVRLRDWGELPAAGDKCFITLVEVEFVGGGRDVYLLPLGIASGSDAAHLYETRRSHILARLLLAHGEAVLFDALASEAISNALLAAIGGEKTVALRSGIVRMLPTAAFAALRGNKEDRLRAILGPPTSSNSLVFFGRRLLLKLFRRLEPGINPDIEIGRFLTEISRFERIPQVAGSFEYVPHGATIPLMLGILQALVPNQGDGWQHAIEELGRYYERASTRMFGPDPVSPDHRPLPELAGETPPLAVIETIGGYLHAATMLGRRTAEMHQAIVYEGHPEFAPRAFTPDDIVAVRDEVESQARRALDALRTNLDRLKPELLEPAERLLGIGPEAIERLTHALPTDIVATKTRIHGDYHLGQVLWVDNDYVLIDFEGEPARSVEERREKFSPVRDVAGMLRSYHYAAYAGLFAFTVDRPAEFARLIPWAELWQQWVSASFLRAYLDSAGGSSFLPRDSHAFAALLDSFMLSKAFYELSYELNNRPDWVRIPLSGVLSLLEKEFEAAAPRGASS